MKKRTLWRAAAVGMTAALLLSGCTGHSDDTPSPSSSPSSSPSDSSSDDPAGNSAADLAILKKVKVDGKVGEKPTVSFDKGLTLSNDAAFVETPGTGAKVVDGDLVTFDTEVLSGSSAKVLQDTYDSDPQTLYYQASQVNPALGSAFKGEKVGARILFATPTKDQSGDQQDTYVYVIDIKDVSTPPTRAKGTDVKPKAGLPKVTLAKDGTPSISIPKKYKEPKNLVAQTLIKGDGDKVKADSQVLAQYSGWTLDGKQFDSSWERGAPAQFALGNGVIEGWTKGLTGQTVGSQVLLVVPPSLGYGDKEQGSIPANSTLVFVVDILAVL